jgi:membrane-associated protease RseP (regulator of RpoE activity)
MRVLASLVSVAMISFPALAADRFFQTPSGQPEVTFKDTSLADAASKVANNCMNEGWMIASQGTNQVVCEIQMDLMRSALTQVLIGNSYSTTPRSFVRVSMAQIGTDVRAQANAWVETQMAFGQMRQQPYEDANTFNRLMSFLTSSGGTLTPGSQRMGVFVGFGGQPEGTGEKAIIKVRMITSGSPAEKAGLQVGDTILKVNRKSVNNMNDFIEKVSKVSYGMMYPLLIIRDGAEQTLMLEARPWPVSGSPEAIALESGSK